RLRSKVAKKIAGALELVSLLANPRIDPLATIGPAIRLGKTPGWEMDWAVCTHCARTPAAVSSNSAAPVTRNQCHSLISPIPCLSYGFRQKRNGEYSK